MPSVALVHDWLHAPGGGEAVLSSLLQLFPNAPLFTLVDFLDQDERARLGATDVRTSRLQAMPGARRWFRYAAALFPQVVERFDTAPYDVIISDSHAIAKGVSKRRGQVHICYCHTPARFAWTMAATYHDRVAGAARWPSWVVRHAQQRFRRWDRRASERVDHFIANSRHIASAIAQCYGRQATVIYPPVDVERFERVGRGERGDHYVTVARLVPYKRLDLVIDAFRRLPQRRLVVIGDGPDQRRLARDLPSNVTLKGHLHDRDVATAMGEARAFVQAACEDFGIAAVEAQAAGTPVIAYREGGSSETVRGVEDASPTGVLFDAQDAASIVDAILRFETISIDPDACRTNAARFAASRFRAEFAEYFDEVLLRSDATLNR